MADVHAPMFLLVATKPRIEDMRELETIIRTSLKNLFREMEPHGCFLSIIDISQEAVPQQADAM
jgi:hypothetical protein